MAEIAHDNNRRRNRIHLTVAALALLAVLMFLSAAWLRLA